MTEFLATALGLAFALVVCLLAVHALLGPWLRFRRAPAHTLRPPAEKHLSPSPQSRPTA
ncbi:MAG TPA: hypothetical protein VF018_15885 [Acidobacteriaceae bacterium]